MCVDFSTFGWDVITFFVALNNANGGRNEIGDFISVLSVLRKNWGSVGYASRSPDVFCSIDKTTELPETEVG